MDQPPWADAPDLPSTLTGRRQDEKAMPTLTDDIKEFIVRGLGRYETPSEVAEAVYATFDIKLTRQQVYRYDPDCSQRPAPRWRELHAAARKAFVNEVADIGVAHKAVRLRLLDRMTHSALANHADMRAAYLLEQAARECGGMYVRRGDASVKSDGSETER
jgi:hypothetical protein